MISFTSVLFEVIKEQADGFLVIVVLLAFNDNLKRKDKLIIVETTSKEVEHLSTENELISTFSWEIFLREQMTAALQQIISLILALVRNPILIPPLSMKEVPQLMTNVPEHYSAKGKYSMRKYIYRIPNIGLTPICLSFFLQTLETNLYLNDPAPCRQPQHQSGGHDPSTLRISLQLVVSPLQLSFRAIGIHNAWFIFFRMLLQSLACARY